MRNESVSSQQGARVNRTHVTGHYIGFRGLGFWEAVFRVGGLRRLRRHGRRNASAPTFFGVFLANGDKILHLRRWQAAMIAAGIAVIPRGRIVDDQDWRADLAGAAFERRCMRGVSFCAGAGRASEGESD